jgi:hypothetical protein
MRALLVRLGVILAVCACATGYGDQEARAWTQVGNTYEGIDSEEIGGPQFVNEDIALTGTEFVTMQGNGWGELSPFNGSAPQPWPITYYQQQVQQLWAVGDGRMELPAWGNGVIDNGNQQFPNAGQPNGAYVFWDGTNNGGSPNARWQVFGIQPERRLAIQWTNRILNSGGTVTFQATFFEQTTPNAIRFQYMDMNGLGSDGSSATIGLEDQNGVNAIIYNNNGLPAGNSTYDGLAVGFLPIGAPIPWPEVPPPPPPAAPGGASGPDDGNKSGDNKESSHWTDFRERACGNAAGVGSSGAFLLLIFGFFMLGVIPRRA